MPCVRRRIGSSAGCAIVDLLQTEASLRVGVNELRLDRARPNECDLHHQIVQVRGPRVQNRGDLRTALDLEHPDRLAARDQVVALRVILWQSIDLGARAGPSLDDVEGAAHLRQRTQSQEIELRGADDIEIILVELHDRPPHRRLLDGEIVAERGGGEDEAADVGGPESR